ncbi:MAG: amidohydrolase family protein, partial [Pseudomonadales bacterium]|nr:amidohydrolase family protein [Pseudomonadales bacterium]
TRDGASAIGLADEIGSLEIGKRADMILVSFDDVHHLPTYDVISHLVYVTDEQDVESVIVEGRVLMKKREILRIDTDRVRLQASELGAKIQAALAQGLKE